MSKSTQFRAQIATLQDELSAAEKNYAAAAEALASDITSHDLRAQVRTASARRSDLREDIAALTEAITRAEAKEQSPDHVQRKLETVAHFNNAKELTAQRNDAAAAVDKALDGVAEAVSAWVAVNETFRTEISNFYRKTFEGDIRNLITFAPDAATPTGAINNALAAQLFRALQGLQTDSVLSFNHHDRADRLERAARDSAKSGENLIYRMRDAVPDLALEE